MEEVGHRQLHFRSVDLSVLEGDHLTTRGLRRRDPAVMRQRLRRPKERYYRDSKGAIISESKTEDKLRQICSDINSMPDSLKRAFMEGVLRALEEEWARIKLQGPISER